MSKGLAKEERGQLANMIEDSAFHLSSSQSSLSICFEIATRAVTAGGLKDGGAGFHRERTSLKKFNQEKSTKREKLKAKKEIQGRG